MEEKSAPFWVGSMFASGIVAPMQPVRDLRTRPKKVRRFGLSGCPCPVLAPCRRMLQQARADLRWPDAQAGFGRLPVPPGGGQPRGCRRCARVGRVLADRVSSPIGRTAGTGAEACATSGGRWRVYPVRLSGSIPLSTVGRALQTCRSYYSTMYKHLFVFRMVRQSGRARLPFPEWSSY